MSSCLSNKKVSIVGGGPTGLVLANLLLQQDPTVQIHILEKAPATGTPDMNSFGFGVGARHERYLQQSVPGLWERIEKISAPTSTGPAVRIVGRSAMCQEILNHIERQPGFGARCAVTYDTVCNQVDLDRQMLTTGTGQEIPYDLLIGADGVNSIIRQVLVDDKGLKESRYLRPSLWKSMKLPSQEGVMEAGAFQPLSHPTIRGAVFPRHPEGYTALIFWKDLGLDNPRGVETAQDLTTAIALALQPKSFLRDVARKLFFFRGSSDSTKPSSKSQQIRFDDKEAQRFVDARPGREHYIKLDRYHDRGVALVGDAAQGMYSFLGQGFACGLQSAILLSMCLSEEKDDIAAALEKYSARAVPEGHAATDLNLIVHVVFGKVVAKLMGIPLLLLGALRGKLLMRRLQEDVTYAQLVRENSVLVWLSRFFWKRERLSYHQRGASNKKLA